jgi:hypothetical protein
VVGRTVAEELVLEERLDDVLELNELRSGEMEREELTLV